MKFGWDIKTVKRDLLVKGALSSFAPEAVIAAGNGRQINGKKLALQLKRTAPSTKIFLIFDRASELEGLDASSIEGVFLRPLDEKIVVRSLAKLSPQRQKVILERFEKIFGESLLQERSEQPAPVVSESKDYSKWLKSVEGLPQQNWQPERVGKALVDIRSSSKKQSLDSTRQDFVKKLFSK